MARIKKVQRDKAIAALKKAGAPAAVAASMWRLLDLEENLDPQIAELVEEDPELFASTATDEDDDTPELTPAEVVRDRLRGGSEHLERKAFRRPAEERPSTASKAAQEAAAHLLKNHSETPAPVRKYRDPVRNINDGHKPLTREPSAAAKSLADRLKGN